MAETVTKVPVTEAKAPERAIVPQTWRPMENLRREIDRLFDDFDGGFWRSPFRWPTLDVDWPRPLAWGNAAPAVDVTEKDDTYEVTAELPGMDEKNIEVKLVNGNLTIRGEKKEERQEKRKDYYVSERKFGSFERSFTVPEGVDVDKIEASFKNGVLTAKLPKKPEAVKPEKKIEVKTAA
jgi:HSP20 family protein